MREISTAVQAYRDDERWVFPMEVYIVGARTCISEGRTANLARHRIAARLRFGINVKGRVWARGYYVSCVENGVTTGIVKAYIENQKKEAQCIQGELFSLPPNTMR